MASLKKKKRQADATEFLSAHYHHAVIDDVKERIKHIKAHVWTPARDDQKVELIAIAYAMLLLYRTDTAMIAGLVTSRKGAVRQDPARAFVEGIYFDEITDGVARTKLLSRWTMAVRHLDEQKIKPSEVKALAARTGEGIDKWSKAKAKKRKATRLLKSDAALVPTLAGQVTIKIGDDAPLRWKLADASHLPEIISKLDSVGEAVQSRSPPPSKPG